MQPGQDRPQGHIEQAGDLLGGEAVHVPQHQRGPVELGKAQQHLAHILVAKRPQVIVVQGVGIRQRVLLDQGLIQREVLHLVHGQLLRRPVLAAELVAEHIHQDGLEPRPGRRVLPQRPKGPVGAQQRLLDQVLGAVADQPPGQPVQGRQLGGGQPLERLLGPVLHLDHPPTDHRSSVMTCACSSKTTPATKLLHRTTDAMGRPAAASDAGRR